MSLLAMLQAEHGNLTRLLDVAEGELVKIENGRDCDRELLRAVAEYWREYPEQCHHPKEDLVLAKLRQRGVLGPELPEGVAREHEELRRLNELLARALGGGEERERGELKAVLRRFVDCNRNHMQHEERSFFPAMRQHLAEEDWEDLEFDLFDRADPVFHQAAENNYRVLLGAILAMEEQRAAGSDPAQAGEEVQSGATDRLAEITTVARFNDLVAAGHLPADVHLRPEPGKGYVLERGGKPITVIPTADEQCAAWCACFFLLGAERA
jgi:hemerythrin-like domain-containing protein